MHSPLRYPGGKQKVYSKVRRIIDENQYNNLTYVEPFAGGFGIGLRLLFDGVVQNVILNDLDRHIYNFWCSVLNHTDALCALIQHTPITLTERANQKNIYQDVNAGQLADGFATLFLNRVNFSGVIKGGPIGGLAQNGKYKLDCRFNKGRLIQQIRNIANYAGQIQVFNKDACAFLIEDILPVANEVFINIDPPYVVKGAQLYTNFFVNDTPHIELAELIQNQFNDVAWIMTYDDSLLIREIYQDCNIREYKLQHSAGKTHLGQELFITALDGLNW